MPTVSPDTVPTVQNFDVEDLLDAASGGSGGNNTIRVQSTQEIVSRRELVHVDMADVYSIPVEDGEIHFGHFEDCCPAYTTQEIQRVTQDAVDSNTSIIKRSTIKQPYNTVIDPDTGKMTVSGTPKSGGLATNAAYFINAVNAAQFCVSAGVALGKGFDSYLYNSNPDYWDSIGLSTLNPETWSSITAYDDSLGTRIFNAIFGIDPDTGNAQMYMDSDAFAYIAECLAEAGILNLPISTYDITDYAAAHPTEFYGYSPTNWIDVGNMVDITTTIGEGGSFYNRAQYISNGIGCFVLQQSGNTSFDFYFFGKEPFTITYNRINSSGQIISTETINAYYMPTYNIYYYSISVAYGYYYPNITIPLSYTDAIVTYQTGNSRKPGPIYQAISYVIYNGTLHEGGNIPGVTTQDDANLPDTSTWTDPQTTDASLRQQYPDLYNNAITYDVPDSDGNLFTKTYIPVSWPMTVNNPWTDTQPTTDTSVQTQTNTLVNLINGLQTQVENLTKTITQLVNDSQTGKLPPDENPTDTGSGSSPTPVQTSGNSSKLWSVYHPTQAQIDAFGSWLWSTNFIDQIMKMFQNPMEGIISLHKVFATPIDAGTGNIVVGTLDSGVSSATVTQQYVYVSCGSVDCHEDFGNVFDYSPHTQVSLYLPFIGIVPLDVSDVMRSTITIEYGVDMFTGACLAMVKVTRDNATVNMYQYAGSASVEYPLSNVQQSQLLSGILAVAAGGAAIATGGMSIPAGAAVAGGLTNTMKSTVGRSGGFSGNAGAMGIKKPYLIIQRPQTKVASLFPRLAGYPTNISGQLSDFSGQVKVTDVHVEGIPATDVELTQIEELLHSGVLV